jgi:branched-chain amino acid transport system substrate-binding protein
MIKSIQTIVVATIVFLLSITPAFAADTYKIGAIMPLSGDIAVYGLNMQKGIDLALEQLNGKGGIKGKKLKIIYEDNQGDPALAVSAMQKLITVDRIPVVIGVTRSTSTMAICPIAEQNKVVVIAPPSTAPEISTKCGSYTFRVIASDAYQGVAMADLIWNLKYREAGVVFVNSDYGRGLRDAFVSNFEKMGGKTLVSIPVEVVGKDFRTELLKVKMSGAKAVMIVGHPAESSIIFKQARELGIKVQWVASEGIKAPETVELAGDAAEGVLVMAPSVDTKAPRYMAFKTAFQAKYNIEPPLFSDFAYDAANMVARAILAGGYSGPNIREGLREVGVDYPGVTGTKTFDENGDVAGTYATFEIKGGKFVEYR